MHSTLFVRDAIFPRYTCRKIDLKSQKSFQLKTSICRDGTLKNQPNKIGTTPQPSLHLVSFCQLCLVFVTCVPCCQLCLACYLCAQEGCLGHGRLWNEQYWVCSTCCCVWRVGCGVGCYNFVAIGCGRHG